MKKVGIVMLFLSFLPIHLLAQEELYINNSEVVKQVAEKAAKSRAKGDQVVQDLYMAIITDAFKDYWSSVECEYPLSIDSLDNLRISIDQLKGQQRVLTESIKSLQKKNVNDPKNDSFRKQIEDNIQHKNKVEKETDSIVALIEEIKDSLMNMKMDLDKIQKVETVMEGKQMELNQLAQNVSELERKCRTSSLLDFNLFKEMESAISSFQEKRRIMSNLDAQKEMETAKKVDVIHHYVELSKVLQDGISQMGMHFNHAKNLAIVESIKKHKDNIKGTSNNQNLECDEIIGALQDQDKAYKGFSSFLDSIVDNNGVISDERMRADVKKDIDNELNKGMTPLKFNKYYTGFQRVLDQLLSDMSPHSSTLSLNSTRSEEGLKRYINGLKNKL